jgi:uncharacterized protein (DUF433 family)
MRTDSSDQITLEFTQPSHLRAHLEAPHAPVVHAISIPQRHTGPMMRLVSRLAMFFRHRRAEHMQFIGAVERRPSLWGGAAVLAGTRIPIFAIEDVFVREGSVEDVIRAFPQLRPADVYFALAFAQYDAEGVERDRQDALSKVPPELRD